MAKRNNKPLVLPPSPTTPYRHRDGERTSPESPWYVHCAGYHYSRLDRKVNLFLIFLIQFVSVLSLPGATVVELGALAVLVYVYMSCYARSRSCTDGHRAAAARSPCGAPMHQAAKPGATLQCCAVLGANRRLMMQMQSSPVAAPK